MGSRYLVTGTQLGILMASAKIHDHEQIIKTCDEILEEQLLYTTKQTGTIQEEAKLLRKLFPHDNDQMPNTGGTGTDGKTNNVPPRL